MAGQGLFFRTVNFMSNNRSLLNKKLTYVNLQPMVMGLKLETRERLKQLKIPEKPKKPVSPYVKFVSEHRSAVIKENPNMKQTDVIKKCAEDWRTISEELKERYTKVYKSECEVYDKEIVRFNTNLTPEQKEAMQAAGEEKKEDKKKRKLRKLYKDMNRPKRPMGAYMNYLVEQSKIKNVSVKDLMLSLKGEWASLPASEKEKYQKQFLKERERYDLAMKEWEEKMLKEGRDDLVRGKTLDEKKTSRITLLKKGNTQ